eukprot:222778_1
MGLCYSALCVLVSCIACGESRTILTCVEDHCSIDCGATATTCLNATIEASEQSSLTVQCGGITDCEYIHINCPQNGDCIVQCDGTKKCEYIHINCPHNGECIVQCYGAMSCQNAVILPKNVSSLHLECLSRSSGSSACSYLSMDLIVRNTLNISCIGSYACSYLDLNVTGAIHTTDVIINGTIDSALEGSNLVVMQAKSVIIYCIGNPFATESTPVAACGSHRSFVDTEWTFEADNVAVFCQHQYACARLSVTATVDEYLSMQSTDGRAFYDSDVTISCPNSLNVLNCKESMILHCGYNATPYNIEPDEPCRNCMNVASGGSQHTILYDKNTNMWKPPQCLPTPQPSVSPTFPSLHPTRVPTYNDPTNAFLIATTHGTTIKGIRSTDMEADGKQTLDMNMILMIVVAAAIVLVLVVMVWFCTKQVKEANRNLKENVIANGLVVLIVIGEYDESVVDSNADFDSPLPSLPLEKDVRHLTSLFKLLNYKIIPSNRRKTLHLHWKEAELVSFLRHDIGKELFDDQGELRYDGLIVVISCHGIQDHIITSDYKTIEKLALHRLISVKYPKARDIPRLFLFDSCEGSAERRRASHINDIVEEEEDCKLEILEQDEQGKGPSLSAIQDGNEWTTSTKNPDYKLVEIHAANAGFQAKAHAEKGSYLIYLFTQKMKSNIEENENKTLLALLDEIQNELHDAGKSQTKNVFNNTTAKLKFRRNTKSHR